MNPNWRNDYLRYKSYFLNVVGRYKERADLKVYLELLLSLLTVSVFAIFALRPTLLTISTLIKEIEAKKETIAKMDDKIDDIIRAQTLSDIERQRVNMLNTAIPNQPDPDVILRQFEGLLASNNATFTGLSIDETVIIGDSPVLPAAAGNQNEEEQTPKKNDDVTFTVSVTSDYVNLFGFLADLEQLRRPIKIDTAEFRKETNQETELLIFELSGKIPVTRIEK